MGLRRAHERIFCFAETAERNLLFGVDRCFWRYYSECSMSVCSRFLRCDMRRLALLLLLGDT